MVKEKLESSAGLENKKKQSAFDLETEEWDKKKIIAGLALAAVLLGGIIGLKMYVLPKSIAQNIPIGPAVKGASTTDQAPGVTDTASSQQGNLPTTEDLQRKIASLEQEILRLNPQEIASSSPEVQQLIQQIQALPSAPGNAAKAACVQLCNRL